MLTSSSKITNWAFARKLRTFCVIGGVCQGTDKSPELNSQTRITFLCHLSVRVCIRYLTGDTHCTNSMCIVPCHFYFSVQFPGADMCLTLCHDLETGVHRGQLWLWEHWSTQGLSEINAQPQLLTGGLGAEDGTLTTRSLQ